MIELTLRLLALGSGAFSATFALSSVVAARKFRIDCEYRSAKIVGVLPPVTVFKPLKGDEPGLYDRLSRMLNQDYPAFQVLFALQSATDSALPLLDRLRREFPKADVEIIISTRRTGQNPKISNLANAYPRAKHGVFVLADSDVRVERDFLRRLVKPLADPNVGLVTCLQRAQSAGAIGTRLEADYLNSQFLPQTLVSGYFLGLRFGFGPVMLVRRTVFEACGGFPFLSEYLADDNVLGKAVVAAGYRITFAEFLIECVPLIPRFSDHVLHMIRWSRTIRVCEPAGYAGTLALQGFALLTLYMLLFGLRKETVAMWLAVLIARVVSTAWIRGLVLSDRSVFGELWLVPLGDLIQFSAWLAGFKKGRVIWRGNAYRLATGGRLVPVVE